MSKKHFVALAEVVRRLKPSFDPDSGNPERDRGRMDQWREMRNILGDFCQSQNGNFNRERWLAYIAGECGPNGGAVKGVRS